MAWPRKRGSPTYGTLAELRKDSPTGVTSRRRLYRCPAKVADFGAQPLESACATTDSRRRPRRSRSHSIVRGGLLVTSETPPLTALWVQFVAMRSIGRTSSARRHRPGEHAGPPFCRFVSRQRKRPHRAASRVRVSLFGLRQRERRSGLSIAREAETRKPKQHHCPGRRLGDGDGSLPEATLWEFGR